MSGGKKNEAARRKLELWQHRLAIAQSAWAAERGKMDRREQLYRGSHDIYQPDGKLAKAKATHVRNMIFELIETQVDSNIPQPKVTAVREEDEALAKMAEDLIRNLLDRLPMERLNDEGERICPVQGGYEFLVDWDDSKAGRGWMGQLAVSLLHAKRVIPQDGIYNVQDMDWLFTIDSPTKLQVKRRYGVDVSGEREEDPDAREMEGDSSTEELVTLYTAYYRNDSGGIGRLRWVGDTILEDLEDYQTRRVKRCRACGQVGDGRECRWCGGKAFAEELMEYEELTADLTTANGMVIPAETQARDEFGQPLFEDVGEPELLDPLPGMDGLLPQLTPAAGTTGVLRYQQRPVMEPTRVPYYKPDMFPVVLRKNVSQYGRFLGGSDVDAVEDQQNALNKLSTKINAKILGGGSFVTKRRSMGPILTDGDNNTLEVDQPSDLECIRVYNTQVDVSADLRLRSEIYEEGRQTIGITDSMQGRKDPTATSKVAKEFSASQAAGRLESKRVMKQAAFADLFELMFKLTLAYADEPRSIVTTNELGEREYRVFDRHDFLYQDETGAWKWNTDFLFSCDSSAPLASNREAMWQEARMNLQQGAYGPPQELQSLVRFWIIMERLHYPTAAEVKNQLQQQMERQSEAMAMQGAQLGGMPMAADAGAAVPGGMEGGAAL